MFLFISLHEDNTHDRVSLVACLVEVMCLLHLRTLYNNAANTN